MKKFNLSINISKIQKNRLRKNTYTAKDGNEVTQTFCDIAVIPLKEEKLIKSGDGWKMYKVGFAVEKGKKEENTNILGDVIEFKNTDEVQTDVQVENTDEIPF